MKVCVHSLENELFKEWSEKLVKDDIIKEVCEFIPDGIVNENEYNLAKYKILFVLKEVNGGKGWGLRKFLAEGGRPQTWDNISCWTEGVFNIDKEFLWRDLQDRDKEQREVKNLRRRIKYLRKICVMNLKKTSGGHTTNRSTLWEAAIRDADFFKKQHDLYNPDITICCGTSSEFFNIIYKDRSQERLQTKRGVWYIKNDDSVIIEYCHPAARINPSLMYYGLIDAMREIASI